MAYDFDGRVAVVTGAAGGIGAALVRALVARGCRVAAVDRDGPVPDAEVHGITWHRLDITDRDAVAMLPAAVLAAHGRVDIVINNAGVAAMGRFDETSLDLFDRVMAVNFGAAVAVTKAFLPHLGTGARIANISSLFGLVAPPGQAPYVASKFALRGFSDALRHELADIGIRVTCVHPGGVRTGIADHALVADAIAPGRADAARSAFCKFLRLDPAVAATRIVEGIAAGRPRVLIGRDAYLGDLLARLLPGGYGRVLAATMGGMRRHVGRHRLAQPVEALS